MKNWTYKNFSVRQFSELDSTNAQAYALADSAQIFDREIIMANAQSTGRGRLGRSWSSPSGNLYFSLVLQPQAPAAQISQLSFVAIVALREAVVELIATHAKNFAAEKFSEISDEGRIGEAKTQVDAEVESQISVENKWPNDLLCDGKKIAGLLLESKITQNNCKFVVLGIGVNITSSPDHTIFPAANLAQFGIEISPEILLQKFLDKFEILYKNWLDFGFKNIRKAWLSKAYRLEKEIEVKDGEKKMSGIFSDLDEYGALILKAYGEIRKISAADIF